MASSIRIRGAREHNLKNISIDLPRDQLVVLTGLSGSGKSSLAFDTLYAEGQRRYVESLSAYARQFLELMPKPDVDLIEGLSPAIAIEQKTTSKNPRSTVGTVTEIYDYLRLLFARVGVPHSPVTGLPILSQTVSDMVDSVMALPEGTRFYVLAPLVKGRKGEYRKELAELKKKGFQRVRVDGTLYEIDQVPPLNKNTKHDIDVVIDRLIRREDMERRLADTFETALGLSQGLVFVDIADSAQRLTFSSRFACPESGFTLDEIEPRLFSFNSPHGACPTCDGLGVKTVFDERLVIADDRLSLAAGAITPWAMASDGTSLYYRQLIEGLARHYDVSTEQPFATLPEAVRQGLLYGSGDDPVKLVFIDEDGHKSSLNKPFEGVIPGLMRRLRRSTDARNHEELSRFQSVVTCHACGGRRLKPEALTVQIAGRNIAQVSALAIDDAASWVESLTGALSSKHADIAARILKELSERLGFLVSVGLGYLTLDRASGTLSGGESQRIRLASQIGSGLTGVLYVLDEPSIGLHQRDNDRLLATLRRLRDLGNTVVVVEHDEDTIRAADYLVDMGPGAGRHGGRSLLTGRQKRLWRCRKALRPTI